MGKAKADKDDETTAADRADEHDEDSEADSDSNSDDVLRPAKSKIGESKDTLRKRSEWFQRRRS